MPIRIRLSSLRKGGWTINSMEHFYAIAASAMRRVLVDCARNRLAARRGGGEAVLVALDEDSSKDRRAPSSPEAVITVGLLMDRLEATDMGAARIVDMHYFAGFTFEEIAGITGLSRRQVWLRWAKGLKWLRGRYQS